MCFSGKGNGIRFASLPIWSLEAQESPEAIYQKKSTADQMACQATIHQAKCGGTRNCIGLHGSAREQALAAASLHWYSSTFGTKLASLHGAAPHNASVTSHTVTVVGICPLYSRKWSGDHFLKFTSPSTFLLGSQHNFIPVYKCYMVLAYLNLIRPKQHLNNSNSSFFFLWIF